MTKKYTLPATLNIDNTIGQLKLINSFKDDSIEISCGSVDNIDTCGLAGLIELKTNPKYRLTDISVQIIDLCNLYQIKLS